MACVASLAEATAQGPAYRERWGYLHLENRRAQVFDELVGRSPADVAKVSELLVAADRGVPFRPVAEALAYLRGVEADDEFVLRSSLGMYVLPEVVDPTATQEACRSANFSVFLPFTIKIPGAITFEVTVRDAAGKQVSSQTIERGVALEELRQARATTIVSGEELPDGAYQVELHPMLNGKPAREHDPELRWQFHVLRGYQQRAESAMSKAQELRAELKPIVRAQLDGLAAHVYRVYTGEAFAVQSDAVVELQRLEACIDNLEHQRGPLAGMSGLVGVAMPTGIESDRPGMVGQEIVQPCIVRLPKDEQPHAMVVFATGSPSYDTGSRRPTAPAMREANWLLRELGDFGEQEQWHLACFDSPGGGRPYVEALLAAIKALPKVLLTGGKKPLLVCDREAASVVGMQLAKFQPHISGLVLVGSGALPAQAIANLGDLPVRYVALHGYPATMSVERTLQYLKLQQAAGKKLPDVAMLHARQEPWAFGVSRSLVEIRQFAKRVFGD